MLAKVPQVVGIFAVIFTVASLFGAQAPPVDTGWRLLNSIAWLGIAFGCLLALAGCGWVSERLQSGETAPSNSPTPTEELSSQFRP